MARRFRTYQALLYAERAYWKQALTPGLPIHTWRPHIPLLTPCEMLNRRILLSTVQRTLIRTTLASVARKRWHHLCRQSPATQSHSTVLLRSALTESKRRSIRTRVRRTSRLLCRATVSLWLPTLLQAWVIRNI